MIDETPPEKLHFIPTSLAAAVLLSKDKQQAAARAITNDLLTAAQAAARAGVSRQRIYHAHRGGQIADAHAAAHRPDKGRTPVIKLFFTPAAVDAWMRRPYANGAANSTIEIPCANCGKPLTRWPSKVPSKSGNAFCDKNCYQQYRGAKKNSG